MLRPLIDLWKEKPDEFEEIVVRRNLPLICVDNTTRYGWEWNEQIPDADDPLWKSGRAGALNYKHTYIAKGIDLPKDQIFWLTLQEKDRVPYITINKIGCHVDCRHFMYEDEVPTNDEVRKCLNSIKEELATWNFE